MISVDAENNNIGGFSKTWIITLFIVLWPVAGADLLWEKSTAGWLVAGADLVWEKNIICFLLLLLALVRDKERI